MPKFIAQAYILYQDVLEYSRFEYLAVLCFPHYISYWIWVFSRKNLCHLFSDHSYDLCIGAIFLDSLLNGTDETNRFGLLYVHIPRSKYREFGQFR